MVALGRTTAARLWFTGAAFAFALDRGLKLLAETRGVAADPGLVAFSLFRNEGIAFSLPLANVIFWPAAAVIFAALLWYFAAAMGWVGASAASPAKSAPDYARAGILATILLGAASNLYDRLAYGYTVDYLQITFPWSVGAVNVADAMIVLGLVALYWRGSARPSRSEDV